MSKILLIVCIVALCSLKGWSQRLPTANIKGRITDKDTQQPLADATVALLHAKDSSHAGTAFSGKNGAFEMAAVPMGAYQVYITYLGYKAQLQPVNITPADTLIDLGAISLQRTGVNLGMVEIVEMRAPMVIKKDTLEFNADYYKTRENAVMEELLKKLPGVQIDRDGTITVNGETVKRILVDGKPFFGDDPKLATRNLPADMIDKVQLIDRKSDQAQFTGIEDGKREKAINITVKESRKQQFFGKMAAGYGTDDRFAANGNLNRFSDGEQLSVLGSANNVNNASFLDGGQGSGGNGLNRAWNAGANYSKDFSDAWKLNGSYAVNGNRAENNVTSARQNLLPDTTYYYNQDARSLNNTTSHVLNMRTEFTPDTLHQFTLDARYILNTSSSDQQNKYQSLNGKGDQVNWGALHNSSSGSAPSFTVAAGFNKRFKKKGRSLSLSANIGDDKSTQYGINQSDNTFVLQGGEPHTDTINQHYDRNSRQRRMQVFLIYTEPLFKEYYLQATYLFTRRRNTVEKYTYDYNFSKHAYDLLNDSLSNAFNNTSLSHFSSISIQRRKGKYDYTVGINLFVNDLNNHTTGRPPFKQHFQQFYPKAFLNYAFTNNKSLHLNYEGSPQVPDVAQLQPVPDNSNPLYIQLGNPDLRLAFTHNLGIRYNALDPVSMRSFSANINASLFNNKIINATNFDSLGRQVSQPVNMSGAYDIRVNIDNSFPIKQLKTAINTSTTLNTGRDVSYINGIKTYTHTRGITQTIGFNYTFKELLDLGINGGVNYNGISYSIQAANNTHFVNYTASFNGNARLPLGFTIGIDMNYWLNTGRATGYNTDVTLLNGYAGKNIAGNRGLFKLQGFDLLNRNVSFSRNVGENYIEDVRTTVLRRFFLLSFTWFFKPGGK